MFDSKNLAILNNKITNVPFFPVGGSEKKANLLIHTSVKECLCFESEDGEDNGAGVDAGEGVAGREEVDVSDDVSVVVVIAAERNQGSHAQAV